METEKLRHVLKKPKVTHLQNLKALNTSFLSLHRSRRRGLLYRIIPKESEVKLYRKKLAFNITTRASREALVTTDFYANYTQT